MGGRDREPDKERIGMSVLRGEYGERESDPVDGLRNEERSGVEGSGAVKTEGFRCVERDLEKGAGYGREKPAGCVRRNGRKSLLSRMRDGTGMIRESLKAAWVRTGK